MIGLLLRSGPALFAQICLPHTFALVAKSTKSMRRKEVDLLPLACDLHYILLYSVLGWDDRVIRVLNGQTMACVAEMIDAHSKGVTAVACKWDCRGIVTGGGEGQVRVWQYTHGMGSSSFKLLAVMKEHKSRVTEIQIRSDDNECVSACEDGTCIIWDLV